VLLAWLFLFYGVVSDIVTFILFEQTETVPDLHVRYKCGAGVLESLLPFSFTFEV